MFSFGLEVPLHAAQLTEAHHRSVEEFIGSDSVLLQRWRSAIQHVCHLIESTSAYNALGSASLQLWLESWRLGRLTPQFETTLSCRTRNDVLDLDPKIPEAIGMRPLETRRWRRALRVLHGGLDEEVPTLTLIKRQRI